MNIAYFSSLKLSLLNEQDFLDFIVKIFEMKRKKSISFAILDEKYWEDWCFSFKKRKWSKFLDFHLIASEKMAKRLSKKLQKEVACLDLNRMLYDLLFYCNKSKKRVAFIGFDEKDQNQIKRNLSLNKNERKKLEENDISSFCFLSSFVLRHYQKEDVKRFLEKMSPDFIVCRDEVYVIFAEKDFQSFFKKSDFIFFLINAKVSDYLISRWGRGRQSFSRLFWKVLLWKICGKTLLSPFIFSWMVVRWILKFPAFLVFYIILRRYCLAKKVKIFT